MKRINSILFVCVENAGRSQMAEALAKQRGISVAPEPFLQLQSIVRLWA